MRPANETRRRPNFQREKAQRKSLGETIKKIRIEHNLTQHDVALALHVTPGYISNVENGRTAMSLKVLIYYAKLTHTSLDSLVGLTVDEYKSTALDHDIMYELSELGEKEKKKILQTIRIWF